MGYNALITVDLPESDDRNRKAFYEILHDKHWNKLEGRGKWVALFDIDIERDSAVSLLINHLKEAKRKSRVKTVNFALQLGKEQVTINTF
jgi:hypothetical protein